jgi:hypothetical protein
VEAKENHAAATVYLDKLAEELTNRGLEAWLMAPPGRVPSVYITNPGARALEENVYADRGKDGLWWFWWSWAERISMADDLESSASAITRVLTVLFAGGRPPCTPRSWEDSVPPSPPCGRTPPNPRRPPRAG